jgi:hypothetical protein
VTVSTAATVQTLWRSRQPLLPTLVLASLLQASKKSRLLQLAVLLTLTLALSLAQRR